MSDAFLENDNNVGVDPFTVMKLHVIKKLSEKGYFAYDDERDDCNLKFESLFIPDKGPTRANGIEGHLLLFKHDTLQEYIQTTSRHLSTSWSLLQFIGNRAQRFESGKHRAVVTVVACYGFGAVHVGHMIQTVRRCTADPFCAAQRSVLTTSKTNCGMFLNLLKNKSILDRTEEYFAAPSRCPLPGLICCHMSHEEELQGTFQGTELPELPSIASALKESKMSCQ